MTPTPSPATRTGARRGLPLGRPFGVPVHLAPSWVVVGVLITYSLAPMFSHPYGPRPGHYVAAAVAAVLFAGSVLAHELGHAAVSLRLGIPIRRITLYLFGGVAEMEREPPSAAGEYLVAVAGPLVSMLLAGGTAVVARSTSDVTNVHRMAAYLALTNAVLAVLNLLPGLPLDGGRVLRAAVWGVTGDRDAGTLAGVRGGQGLALVAFAIGFLRIGAGDPYGLFELVVGAFLWLNATALGRRTVALRRVGRVDVGALARPALLVDAAMPLSEALRRAVESGRRLLVVDAYGVPAGVISGQALAAVPERRRPWVSVADVARPLEPGLVLDAGLDGERLLDRLRATPATEYLVTAADGSVAGVLSAHDVARVLDGTETP
ncbi:MAG TPA: M50 family metallopeptidase [Mycobacteriales bacterium]|jgi:Zn-dependent protease